MNKKNVNISKTIKSYKKICKRENKKEKGITVGSMH